MIIKCKMCGGNIEFNNNDTTGTCDSCGSRQTFPKISTEKKMSMYERAIDLRISNEYDKAAEIYEDILSEDATDAETYWSLVLCKYGIEYIDDPATHKKIPTINRTQNVSVFNDSNYQAAIKYSDSIQREIYKSEAETINEIQKKILAISALEEPFDVFICYKETDINGRRTQDSVLANDLYHILSKEGFKVFFSRITLETKLGQEYEPYIYSALNSSKVMIVIGTRPEYFNSVWVKNEWSRFLGMIKDGADKTLIPAFKDMNPYDLPDAFSHLQAQDMSVLGFTQDLIHGIKKIIQKEPEKTEKNIINTVYTDNSSLNITALIQRMNLCIEDGEFQQACTFAEKILNEDAQNGSAYLVLLLSSQKCKNIQELENCKSSLDNNKYYIKTCRFSDEVTKNQLVSCNEIIKQKIYKKNEQKKSKKQKIFKLSSDILFTASVLFILSFIAYNTIFPKIEYNKGVSLMESRNYKQAIIRFNNSGNYLDSADKLKEAKYMQAVNLTDNNELEQSIRIFSELKDYKDSDTKRQEITYQFAGDLNKQGNTDQAVEYYRTIESYKDSKSIVNNYDNNNMLKSLKANDIFEYGTYHDIPLKWKALSVSQNDVLAITEEAVSFANLQGNEEYTFKWNNCALRKWLNVNFYQSSFNIDEKKRIISKEQDKVTMLSKNEVSKYQITELICNSTWWIKTLDVIENVYYMDESGIIEATNNRTLCGVRPVIRLSLE